MRACERKELFHPPGKEVTVTLLGVVCDHCGMESVLSSQMAENIARRQARKSEYGEYLLGEEIFAFRRKYGLSQPAASAIFGKGKIAFSRYENEKSFPEISTTKLLRMAMKYSHVLKDLADESNVEIPLWDARSADERVAKLSKFKRVETPTVLEDTFAFDAGFSADITSEIQVLEVSVG